MRFQLERTDLPPRDVPCAMDSNLTMHLADRAPKHEHQAEPKKEFADDLCVHIIQFLSLFFCFPFHASIPETKDEVPELVCVRRRRPPFA
jgi:hypothetical protein